MSFANVFAYDAATDSLLVAGWQGCNGPAAVFRSTDRGVTWLDTSLVGIMFPRDPLGEEVWASFDRTVSVDNIPTLVTEAGGELLAIDPVTLRSEIRFPTGQQSEAFRAVAGVHCVSSQ